MPQPCANPFKVLVADDQPDVLDALRLLLQPEGFRTALVQSPAALVRALREDQFDLLLMDLNYARDTTSGREGLELLGEVKSVGNGVPVVVMTGWGTMEIAVEALRGGVRDFVQKPWDNDHLLAVVRRLTEEHRAARERTAREQRDADEARQIQRGLLPHAVPAVPGWQFGTLFEPASHVGGDVYELAVRPDGGVAVCLADVAGKGVPAALLAASLQTAVRSAALRCLSTAELCSEVNRALTVSIPGNRFATFFCGLLNPATGDFSYTNAGHNPPLLARASGVVERLSASDLVLGVKQDAVYYEHGTRLSEGDCLLVYSDGMVEATNGLGEEFGEAGLSALLGERRTCHPVDLAEQLHRAVVEFAGPVASDDRTAVIVGRTGSGL